MTKDEKIAKLGKELPTGYRTARARTRSLPNPLSIWHHSALKYTAYKYDQKMADDILDICLTMKKRVAAYHRAACEEEPAV